MKLVMSNTQTEGRQFVLARRNPNEGVVFVAQGASGTKEWGTEILVGGNWVRWLNNRDNLFSRQTSAPPPLIRIRPDVTTGTAGITMHVGLDAGMDERIIRAPLRPGAVRTAAMSAGDVTDFAFAADFSFDEPNPSRVKYSAVSASPARATVVMDAFSGVLTVTAVSAGSSVITVTVTDRFGWTVTQTLTVTVS